MVAAFGEEVAGAGIQFYGKMAAEVFVAHDLAIRLQRKAFATNAVLLETEDNGLPVGKLFQVGYPLFGHWAKSENLGVSLQACISAGLRNG